MVTSQPMRAERLKLATDQSAPTVVVHLTPKQPGSWMGQLALAVLSRHVMVSVDDRRPESPRVPSGADWENQGGSDPRSVSSSAAQSGSGEGTSSPDGTLDVGFANLAEQDIMLTPDEQFAVFRMIYYERRTERPTKAGRIFAGFGLKKGGGPRYTRASDIHDVFFNSPDAAVRFRPTQANEKQRVWRENYEAWRVQAELAERR